MVEQSESAERAPWWLLAAAALLLLAGLGVRLHGLGDSPVLFHPTRQLHSAIETRAIYLDRTLPASDPLRQQADRAAQIDNRLEAPINPQIVAALYQLSGGEHLWIAGVWSSLVWLSGGAIIFALLRRFTTPLGQLSGLAVHVLAVLGVEGGRSFQPDPLMVTLILATALLVVRHDEDPTWRRLVAAGACAGAAVLVKVMALPIVIIVFAAFLLGRRGVARSARDLQAWAFVGLSVAVLLAATAIGWSPPLSHRSEEYFVSSLLTTRWFYGRWWTMLADNVGIVVLAVGILGALASKGTARRLLAALWIGYLVTCIAFDYRIASHSYYHLSLIPILALGWGIAIGAIPEWLDRHEFGVARLVLWPALAACLVAGLAMATLGQERLRGTDPRDTAAAAAKVTGTNAKVLGITDSYGRELAYYGRLQVLGEIPSDADRALLVLQHRPMPSLRKIIQDSDADWLVISSTSRIVAEPKVYLYLARHYVIVRFTRHWAVFDLHQTPTFNR